MISGVSKASYHRITPLLDPMSMFTPTISNFLRVAVAAAGFIMIRLVSPAEAEIVSAQCRLIRYGGQATPAETFPCDFRQSGGNVQVWSQRWKFDFPYREQGKTYIRINRIPLTLTRIGQYTLEITQ